MGDAGRTCAILVIVGVLQLGVAVLLGVRDVLAQRFLLDDVRVLLARLRPRVHCRALSLPSLQHNNTRRVSPKLCTGGF